MTAETAIIGLIPVTVAAGVATSVARSTFPEQYQKGKTKKKPYKGLGLLK